VADIEIDAGQVQQVQGILNQAADPSSPLMTGLVDLQNAVAGLLTPEGGLFLQKASPYLKSQYDTFTANIRGAILEIPQFAQQFGAIVTQVESFDTSIAGH
jgi:hypothetical protein